jgi:hypothetical protein
MKQAMRAKEKMRLGTIRMALAAVKQREVDERIELDDAQVLATLDKLVKQRREAEAQYRDAGRDDLADTEAAERDVLSEFLPEPLSDGDLDALIQQSIQSTGAESMRDMGKVMAELKPQVQGRTDMGALSARVKAQLTG